MKRQIVLEDGQLIEMVNESARRVLRGLMTEGWFYDTAGQLADRYGSKYNTYGTVSPEVDNALKTLANSEEGRDILNAFDEHADEGFMKLCVDHPEVITTLATNPTLAYNMTRDNNFVQNLCNNEAVAQQFGADANSVAAQYGYGTEAQGGMGFVQQGASGGTAADVKFAGTDMNGQPIFTNAQGQIVQGIMQYGQDQNGNPIFVDGNGNIVNIDTGQGQQGQQEQQGNWWTNALAGTTIGDMLGIQNPNQAQYSDDQALMYLQNMTNADVQIADIEAQIAQMEKKDPNNPALGGLKANLQLLNNQKQMYQPYLQGYYSNLTKQCGDLEAKIRSGQQLTPDEMNRYSQANQTLMAINGSPAYQYMASTQGNKGLFPNNPTLNKIASFLGFNGINQQQQQGAQSAQTAQATAQQPQNAQGGQQRQRQPQPQQQRPVTQQRQPQQQRPVAQQRQPAQQPAVVDTGATNQATQQPVTPVQTQAPTTRVMNPQGGAGQPQPQSQGRPQVQPQQQGQPQAPSQPAQPTVATHSAGGQGQQGQPKPQQVPGRTIQAGALNANMPNRQVAGYNPNFNPNNVRVRPMQVPQNPYQQQRR